MRGPRVVFRIFKGWVAWALALEVAGRCPWWPDLGDPGERSPCRWAAGGCAQWLLFTNWQRNISGLSLLAWREASLVHTGAVAAWQRRRKQQASLGCEELIM